ncbi:MAG: non-heme iron oxygenase ferredoxin subunit [Candidatus Eremiobacteraeota bacterium]|nr:non-heme iron oxygenase ferredoxin subunit [Candidatus Eremiobacteraeota bacterium]
MVVEGTEVLLCHCDGEIFAIEDLCTHDGGELDQGELEGCRIMCPRHGSYFDVKTGAALTLPAVLPVSTYAVTIEGDDIYVDV